MHHARTKYSVPQEFNVHCRYLMEVRHGETVCFTCGYEGESQKDAEIHIGKLSRFFLNPNYFFQFEFQSSVTNRKMGQTFVGMLVF